jgi:hypothetical protein
MSPWTKTTRRKRLAIIGTVAALIVLPGAVYGYDALTVDVPAMPAVGESVAGACDDNGVATTYTYGPTSSNGIKVNAVTVTGVAESCTNLTVAFMNGSTTVATYSGAVSTGSATLSTNVWTSDFTSVRVALYP